jgi:hypothetical protein
MDRISDEELERITTMYCNNDSVLYALTELRERRAADNEMTEIVDLAQSQIDEWAAEKKSTYTWVGDDPQHPKI